MHTPHGLCREPIKRGSGMAGFTMIELMAVMLIMGGTLMIALANYRGSGIKMQLESAANTMVAVLTTVRETAIIDGYPAAMELGMYREEGDSDERQGYRMRASNIRQELKQDEDADDESSEAFDRTGEREVIYTDWAPLPDDVVIAGISRAKDKWVKVSGGEPVSIVFGPDGNVDSALAIRLEHKELRQASKDKRFVTVFVNGLTSAASWQQGEKDLTASRPSADFGN